jgi:hypothetical protein
MNPKVDILFEKIRNENLSKYGTAVGVYGPVLLANLYPDGVQMLKMHVNGQSGLEIRINLHVL